MVEVGKQRSAGIVILLCIVTLGVYWFVWQWKAFGELERHKGADLKKAAFMVPMVLLWLVMVGIGATVAIQEAQRASQAAADGTPSSPPNPFLPKLGPMQYASMAIGVVFYAIQAVFQVRATKLVAASLPATGDAPSPALAIVFNVLSMGSGIPILGLMLGLGALVVAIVWIVKVQGALNMIWSTQTPPLPPMNFAPQPTMR